MTSLHLAYWWEHRPEDDSAMERSREMAGIARRAVREAGLLWPGDALNAGCRRAGDLDVQATRAFAWTCAARCVEWRAALGTSAALVPGARQVLETLRANLVRRVAGLEALVAAADRDLFDPELDQGDAFEEAVRDHVVVAFPVLRPLIQWPDDAARLCMRDAIMAAWMVAETSHPLPEVTGWVARAERHATHACQEAVQYELFLQAAQLEWLETRPPDPTPPRIGDEVFERLLDATRRRV